MNPSYTLRNKRVWVAGHRGLVGSALVRRISDALDRPRPELVQSVGDYAAELVAALDD